MSISPLKYRDLIVVLLIEKQTLLEWFGAKEKYKKLLLVLDEYDIDDGPLPYQKDLLPRFDLNRTQLMRLMNDLYQDFSDKLSNPNIYKVSETEVWFLLESREENFWSIGVDDLEVLPKEGQLVHFPFIRGEFSTGYFQVERISHEFENGKHTINMFLNQEIDW